MEKRHSGRFVWEHFQGLCTRNARSWPASPSSCDGDHVLACNAQWISEESVARVARVARQTQEEMRTKQSPYFFTLSRIAFSGSKDWLCTELEDRERALQ